ncbi:fimbria/pilus periplasmic chaperone [Salmonella enterica subsp. diarizonae]|nr:fimbria/pilus periplasmic chaperone [Salmonella enterica subsp. diarizonae]
MSVTPPIFRLNQDEQTRIRVILTNKSEIPKDREKMFWLCVKAIPPESKVNLLTRVEMVPNECIKLFVCIGYLSGPSQTPRSIDDPLPQRPHLL